MHFYYSYYFNDKIDEKGNHKVHTEGCRYLPDSANSSYIGVFSNLDYDISKAKLKYPNKAFVKCPYCSL